MDPNAALERIRALLSDREYSKEDFEALAEAFEGLDGWLSKGGFLPDAWDPRRHETALRQIAKDVAQEVLADQA